MAQTLPSLEPLSEVKTKRRFFDARTTLFRCFNYLDEGELVVEETFLNPTNCHRFGVKDSGQRFHLEVKDERFYLCCMTGGSIGAAEAYIRGYWDSEDLSSLVCLFARNLSTLDKVDRYTGWATRWMTKISHWGRRNSLMQSEKNIQAHYDLGNDFYQLFLDDTMLYSSAIFELEQESLTTAQHRKMQRLCEQLELSRDDTVLEIGTGWGAMAIYMAKNYGCKVTTTTISNEQFIYACERVKAEGLEELVKVVKQDYRLLTGTYDKIVSIEMIEAVGKAYLNGYIAKCNSLLKPGGRLAIQAITIADQRYDYYQRNVDFIQKYIFPGGFLPSVTKLLESTTKSSDLVLRNLHDIGDDYRVTLKKWRETFESSLPDVKALGFDDQFIRMWRFYLCYCEGGFKAKSISTVQLLFERA
jgi:cyclopropane-fatty-acyl-phospholipid synthase